MLVPCVLDKGFRQPVLSDAVPHGEVDPHRVPAHLRGEDVERLQAHPVLALGIAEAVHVVLVVYKAGLKVLTTVIAHLN